MTSYIYLVYEAGLPLMAGYNHSQEYLGQNLGLEPFVRQAFARRRGEWGPAGHWVQSDIVI